MRFTLAALALPIGLAVSQGVTSAIAPKTTAPAGCVANYDGKFQIQVVNVTKSSKRDIEERADGELVITLKNGILLDNQGRTGYIADNRQFQFDGPAQTGAIYTAGWSVCPNGSLAIGGDAVFSQCLSGTFYNLYDEPTAAQCSPVYIEVIKYGGTGAASAISDGQVTASPQPISQISDGQPQATTGKSAPITQISDGQIQATKSASTSAILPVTVKSDGQVNAPTGRNGTVTSATPTASRPLSTYTGAAALPTGFRNEIFGLAAGAVALAML